MADRPDDTEIAKWHRFFAIELNNRAWALADESDRSPEATRDMIDAAHAAALHWGQVGTETNRMRAQMLLAHVHALSGHGEFALELARPMLEYFANRDTPDWEIAFAHAIVANAAYACGESKLHRSHHAEAERLGQLIADAEDRKIFLSTFGHVPRPPAVPEPAPHFGQICNVRVFMEDLAKGVRFYRDVLGLRLRWESDDVAVFDTGTATLMLESAHDHAGKEDPGTGRFLGVTLEAPDLARTYRALSERGVEFLHPPQAQTWGGVMTHFRDPSGNVVTAVQFVASRRA